MLEENSPGNIKHVVMKSGAIFILMITFCIILALFYEKIGSQIFIFYFIPVGLTAYCFGLWPALIMQTFLIFLGAVLLSFVMRIPFFELFGEIIKKNTIGIISHYTLIALLGYMRDQHLTIKRLNREIIRISKIDELTGIYNRRAILAEANQQLLKTREYLSNITFFIDKEEQKNAKNPVSNGSLREKKDKGFTCKRETGEYTGIFTCVLFDIDHFKKINDSFGHLAGDKVLQKIGNILNDEHTLRSSDICGRYGGEEFLILFPGTSACNSIYAVNRIIEKIKNIEFRTNNGCAFSITISTGITQFDRNDKDINEIIHRADSAMYYAKQQGRNQIIIYEDQSTEIEKIIV